MSRTNKVIRNLLSEILPQIIIMLLGLVKSKYYLDYLGGDTVGLVSLFSQIIGYLSLVEGGIGQAVIYKLYDPIVHKDYKKISRIKNGTRNIFKKIIVIIFILSILAGFIIPYLIKDNQFSFSYIIVNFILYVLSEIILYTTVFERSIYVASERSYKINRIIKTSLILKHICEILLAILIRNLSIIFICLIIISIIENAIIRIITKRDFANLPVETSDDKSVLSEVKNLLAHKIAGLISTNIDIILISKFLGLGKVLIYSTYLLYLNALISLTNKISRAVVGTIGNIIIENKEYAKKTFIKFNNLVFFIALIVAGPFNLFINSFIKLFYNGKVFTSITISSLFTIILVYNIIRLPLLTYSEGSGLFKETKICPILESIINLGLSLILINYYGINGCLIGTILSLVISEYFIKPNIIYSKIFGIGAKEYYIHNIKFIVLIVLQIILCCYISNYLNIQDIVHFVIYLVVYMLLNVVVNMLLFILIGEKNLFDFIKKEY